MEPQNDEDAGRKASPIGRRRFMQGIGAAAVSTMAIGSVQGASNTVDLGQKGLSSGDAIDSYLEQHFKSGNEVHIPAGEYKWNGGGLGGDYSDAALVGDGEVIWKHQNSTWNVDTFATGGGNVTLKNITIKGQLDSGGSKCRLRFDARDSNSKVILDNFNLPDGDTDGGRSIGIYVGKENAGTVKVTNCYISGFPNNGLYADGSSLSSGGGGSVHVSHSKFENNNIDAIRVGGDGDVVENCVIVQKDVPTAWNGGDTGRGLRVRYPGKDITIKNVHITANTSKPVVIPDYGNGGGSGSIENICIENNTGGSALYIETGSWSGSNINVTGDGNRSVSGFDSVNNVKTGSNAESPVKKLSKLDGSTSTTDGSTGGSNGGSTSTTDGSTGGSTSTTDGSNGASDLPHIVTIHGSGPETPYEFTVSGDLEKSTANDASINTDDSLEGSTATGQVFSSEDSYAYSGEIASFDIGSEATVAVDGQRVDPETFGAEKLPNTITISGSTDNAENYEFSVSGDLKKSEANGASINPDDSIEENTATGQVFWSEDSYEFSGEIESFTYSGNPNVAVNGEEVDIERLGAPELTNRLLVDGSNADGDSTYVFEVSGEVAPSADFPVEDHDSISGSRIEGKVMNGVDGYRYSGDLVSFYIDGSATVTFEDNDG